MKQLLCLILSVAMLIGCIAPVGYAAEISTDADVVAQTGDVAIEATNGIGSLLSAEISEVEEETSASELSSHVITDVVVENSIAKVSYSAEDYATVVVALYSEDGLRLLSSTSGVATPDASEVELSFQGDMPEYFLVRAYMMDSEDCTPLSEMYETPIYTQSMQELLDSTIDDYDPDLVVNFDDDPTTNFAVYNEGVVIVDEVDGVNIVTTNDDENLLYVIENADEIFTSLQSGDIVSYFYGDDEILLCKVDTISVEDNCVTIHGSDNMELKELFSHIKLEMVMDNSDLVEIDDPEASVDSQSGTYAVASLPNGDSSIEVKPIHFDFYHQFPGAEDEGLNGYIDVLLDNTTDLYFADGKTHYQWELKYELSCNFKITVLDKEDKSLTVPVLKNFKLGSISAVGMVYDPQFVFTANCSVNVNTTIYGSSGINCATGRDPINITTPMKMDAQVDIEGNVFIGFDLKPAFYVLNKNVLKVDMSVPIGGHLNGSLTGNAFESTLHQSGPDLELHECDVCLKGEIYGSVSLEVSIKFFNSKKIELGGKVSKKFLSFPFYWSFTFGDIDWGSCPYKQYLVAFQVIDQEYAPVSNVTIHADDLSLHTDETGTAVGYFYAGSINVQVSYADLTESKRYNIDGPGRKIKIVLGEEEIEFKDFLDESLLDEIIDNSWVTATGMCGDNVTWSYYDNQTLVIEGFGPMWNFDTGSPGWPRSVKQVYIIDGVTHLGNWAFSYVYSYGLQSVHIPESVSTIGSNAFNGAYFTEITIPDLVTTIGDYAFMDSDLNHVVIPDSVSVLGQGVFKDCVVLRDAVLSSRLKEIPANTFEYCWRMTDVVIPDSVEVIGSSAFINCERLTNVTLPDSITRIEDYAFAGTDSLINMVLPDKVSYLGDGAFHNSNLVYISVPNSLQFMGDYVFKDCHSLTSIYIPFGVTRIGECAFYNCTSLTEISIPDSVTEIAPSAFGYCVKLGYVDIPESVTSIGIRAFYHCRNLKNMEIPEGVSIINEGTFYCCTGLSSVTLPNSLTTIGDEAFYGCESLLEISIPDSVNVIGDLAFRKCESLTSAVLPNRITSIANSTFSQCSALTEIYIPDSVQTIGSSAFSGCTSLLTVELPNDLLVISNACFSGCTSLRSIDIPDGVTSLGNQAFGYCSNLISVNIPNSVTALAEDLFSNCVSLRTINIPSTCTSIPADCFRECVSLEEVIIPVSVDTIYGGAFASCDSLSSIWFAGRPYKIDSYAFNGVTANAYYPGDDSNWRKNQMLNYGGKLSWYPYSYDENGDIVIGEPTVVPNAMENSEFSHIQSDFGVQPENPAAFTEEIVAEVPQEQVLPTPDAIIGGEYGYENSEDYIQRTASFSGLMPGEEYVMLSLVSIDTDQPVTSENLLYIAQAESGEDGNLSFTYVQRVTTDPSYVVLCGPATKTLAEAQILVPEYYTDGELHVINPNVVYDGETLLEGRDYEITGQVCFTEAGTYTCFIRGIHNYTGTMQCVYTVGEWNCDENGHDFEDGFCRYCDEEDPDAQPTEPTEPSDPTDPSEPIDPTEPTEPIEPAGEGVIRLSGANRYETGFAVADQLKKNLGVDQFEAVVVAYGQNFPDALTGSYLAAVKNAPILLTEKSVDHTVAAYIDEKLVSGGTVYILGGAAAVSESFENALRSRGFVVKRLKGAGRYETNLAILKEAGVTTTDEVLIATGKNYADSLSASATGLPMLLVDKELSEAQKVFLETTSGKFVIIGGTGAVSADVEAELDAIGDVTRVKGANRYGTSVEIAKRYFTDPEFAVLAYAQGFPDGLCGGPLALSMGAPLILTSNDSFAAADDYVTGISSGAVTGGTSRISDDTVRAIFDLSPDTPVVKP